MRLLIELSLSRQEQARVVAEGAGGGQRAMVVGGAGQMGNWFAHFLTSQGYLVCIADPNASHDSSFAVIDDWAENVDYMSRPWSCATIHICTLKSRR